MYILNTRKSFRYHQTSKLLSLKEAIDSKSQSIKIIFTVSGPILDSRWKPIQPWSPYKWCYFCLAEVDRNEQSDKGAQTSSSLPITERQEVWQIMKLTLCSFLTHIGSAQTELPLGDSSQTNHHARFMVGWRMWKSGCKMMRAKCPAILFYFFCWMIFP